jgi:hypothetical protein
MARNHVVDEELEGAMKELWPGHDNFIGDSISFPL